MSRTIALSCRRCGTHLTQATGLCLSTGGRGTAFYCPDCVPAGKTADDLRLMGRMIRPRRSR